MDEERRGDIVDEERRGDMVDEERRGDMVDEERRGDMVDEERRGDMVECGARLMQFCGVWGRESIVFYPPGHGGVVQDLLSSSALLVCPPPGCPRHCSVPLDIVHWSVPLDIVLSVCTHVL